jgi:hypothetical protein
MPDEPAAVASASETPADTIRLGGGEHWGSASCPRDRITIANTDPSNQHQQLPGQFILRIGDRQDPPQTLIWNQSANRGPAQGRRVDVHNSGAVTLVLYV